MDECEWLPFGPSARLAFSWRTIFTKKTPEEDLTEERLCRLYRNFPSKVHQDKYDWAAYRMEKRFDIFIQNWSLLMRLINSLLIAAEEVRTILFEGDRVRGKWSKRLLNISAYGGSCLKLSKRKLPDWTFRNVPSDSLIVLNGYPSGVFDEVLLRSCSLRFFHLGPFERPIRLTKRFIGNILNKKFLLNISNVEHSYWTFLLNTLIEHSYQEHYWEHSRQISQNILNVLVKWAIQKAKNWKCHSTIINSNY